MASRNGTATGDCLIYSEWRNYGYWALQNPGCISKHGTEGFRGLHVKNVPEINQ